VRGVRPCDTAAKTLRALAMDLFSEVRQLDRRIAKAANDIRALRHQLHEMTTQLARVEHQGVTGRTNREVRMEAAELRREIEEAQALIYQLQRRYLNGDGSATKNSQPRAVRPGCGRW
jgi:predicted RNase H-like nuclease (RuvC/YqgF family)